MKKAALVLLLLLMAVPARAEVLDGGFFTCEVPNTENWQMFDAGNGAKNILNAQRNLAVSVTLIEPAEDESLYLIADKLARLHGASLRRPADPQDPDRDLWEYSTRIEGQGVYAQLFMAGKKVAYIVVVGNAQDDDIISIFNSIKIQQSID